MELPEPTEKELLQRVVEMAFNSLRRREPVTLPVPDHRGFSLVVRVESSIYEMNVLLNGYVILRYQIVYSADDDYADYIDSITDLILGYERDTKLLLGMGFSSLNDENPPRQYLDLRNGLRLGLAIDRSYYGQYYTKLSISSVLWFYPCHRIEGLRRWLLNDNGVYKVGDPYPNEYHNLVPTHLVDALIKTEETAL